MPINTEYFVDSVLSNTGYGRKWYQMRKYGFLKISREEVIFAGKRSEEVIGVFGRK